VGFAPYRPYPFIFEGEHRGLFAARLLGRVNPPSLDTGDTLHDKMGFYNGTEVLRVIANLAIRPQARIEETQRPGHVLKFSPSCRESE